MSVDYSAAVGKLVTAAQLINLLQNIKSHIKTKTDLQVTGNKPIKLKAWEKEFIEMIEQDNPVYHKIPGSVSVGTSFQQSNPGYSTQKMEENETDQVGQISKSSDPNGLKQKIRKSVKVVSTYETDETSDLSTPQLQSCLLYTSRCV